MIESLSGENVRRGLSLVREFLASGHTNADRAIAAYLQNGDYRFPRHEVFRGAVLGSFRYFNDAQSLLPNLYDAKLGTYGLQLLRLQLVSVLVASATEQPSEGIAFVDLAGPLGRLGVTERDLLLVVEDLFRRGLFRTLDGLPVRTDSTLFPTRLAGFALRQLCREFAYGEFCAIDTVIFDADSWERLREITTEIEATHGAVERMRLRAKRLEIFYQYVIRGEEKWIVECRRRDVPKELARQIVRDEIWPAAQGDAAAAIRSAERVYGAEASPSGAPTEARLIPTGRRSRDRP